MNNRTFDEPISVDLAAGEALVQGSRRKVKIENTILREGGLPTLFVARYLDRFTQDHYFFYLEELTLSKIKKRA